MIRAKLKYGAGLVFLAVFLAACSSQDEVEESGDDEERGTPVAAVEVGPRDLSREFRGSGTVTPRAVIRLASRTSGTLQEVYFEEGEPVGKGELLLQLDVTEQEAELARASALEEQARLEYRRVSQLRERDISSAAEYEEALSAVRVAESERHLWESRVAHGRITAPRDGVVTARFVEPGESVNGQQPLMELASMEELVIRTGVSELDVVHLQSGQPVPVTLDAMPGVELEGTIRRIFPTAEAGSRLVTVEVALPADASHQGVRPGFLARLRVTVDRREDVLAVPSAAIGEQDDARYVLTIDDGVLETRFVETGVSRGQWTEIVAGLDAGELVLASNPIDREPGERVRVVSRR